MFDLSAYLVAGHAHRMLRPPAWTERVLDWIRADAGLTKSLGMREIILENVKRWSRLLWAVAEAGVDEVYLTFASSLPDQSGNADGATPSVNAFWRHVWGPRQRRLEAALATHARSVFCNQARTDSIAALNLAREGTGLRMAAGPDADGIVEAETAAGAAHGADIRRSVKMSPMERGRGLDTVLASLSSEHRCISEWRDRTIERIERLREDWESLLPRAVAELNLDAAWPCAELRPEQLSTRKPVDDNLRDWLEKRRRFDSNEGEVDPQKTTTLGSVHREIANALQELAAGWDEGDFDAKAIRIVKRLRARLEAMGKEVDDEYWAERHRLKHRDVDGYYGSLRGGSLLADAWPWPEAALELSEWLAEGEGTSVGERIGDELRNAGEDGLRPRTRAFLWQLADHGPYDGDRAQRTPDYGLFAPGRWWETERLLLRTLVNDQSFAGERIRGALGILDSLARIAAAGLGERGVLEARVREAVRRFLIARTFDAMGLKRTAWGPDRNALRNAVKIIREGVNTRRTNVKEWVRGWTSEVLTRGEEDLRPYWKEDTTANLAEGGRRDYAGADTQLAFIEACLDALDATGGEPVRETDEGIVQTTRRILEPVERRCREHNSEIETYAEDTALRFLEVYATWLGESVTLTEEERAELDRVVYRRGRRLGKASEDAQPKQTGPLVGTAEIEKAIGVFERIIAARAGKADR